jgi:hypothetical protein
MEHAFGQLSGDTFAENTLDKLAGYTEIYLNGPLFYLKTYCRIQGFATNSFNVWRFIPKRFIIRK